MSKSKIKKLLAQASKIVAIYNDTLSAGDQSFGIEKFDTTLPECDPYVRVTFHETYSLSYLFLEPLAQYCIRYKITFSVGKVSDKDAYYIDIS